MPEPPDAPLHAWTGFRQGPLFATALFLAVVAESVNLGVDFTEPVPAAALALWALVLVGLPVRAAFHRRIVLTADELIVHRTFGTAAFRLSEIGFLQENRPGGIGPQWPKLLIRDTGGRTCRTWSLGREHERIVRTVRDAVTRASGADPMAYEDEEAAAH
ncbi:hypothetical protein [Actinomadura gamaensis]|uniref:PH domain-containing protein n=1 Tax=Actinomadura gamaensis TaxID=1763541 RepID=A0ABV9U5Y8_9ACTN